MHKFLEKWNALPVHKQVASIGVTLVLSYSLYTSIVTVQGIPVINYLQQDSRHEP